MKKIPLKEIPLRAQEKDLETSQDKINVKNEMEYKQCLAKLKDDFEKRHSQNEPSPKSGLDGFEKLSFIGCGSFGKVFLVRDEAGRVYAAKILQKENCIKSQVAPHIVREKCFLSAFRFPFILWLEWSRKDYEYLYLGLPMLHGGDLFALHQKYNSFCEDDARFYAAQICLALEYLHCLKIVYRDLKLENILIDREGFIRLADFGSSKLVENRTLTLCGTPEYMSPEIILGTPYSTSPDWWAFGVLIYELVFGFTPFYSKNSDMVNMSANITNAEYTMPAKFSENLQNLIHNLLIVDFTNRLGCRYCGVDEVKQHAWFRTIDWIKYLEKNVTPVFVPKIKKDTDVHYFKGRKGKYFDSYPERSYTMEFQDF